MQVQRSPAYWEGLVRMSLSKLFLLRALLEAPAHGYELARRAEALSEGVCSPTEGAIYPVLREWEQAGLVAGAWETYRGRQRRIYRITEEGRAAYDAAYEAWAPAARAVLAIGRRRAERLQDHLL